MADTLLQTLQTSPNLHSMLTLSTAALLAAGLVVLLLRLFQHRRSLRQIQGPPRLFSLLGECIFTGNIADADSIPGSGHEVHMSRQDEVGDLEFKWLRQYGPTWRIQGAFGVSAVQKEYRFARLTNCAQADVLMTGDPKVGDHSGVHPLRADFPHITGLAAHLPQVWSPLREDGVAEPHEFPPRRPQHCVVCRLVSITTICPRGLCEAYTCAGADHQRHRKVMNPAFSAPQLRSFLPLFQRITTKVSPYHISFLLPGLMPCSLSAH